MIKARDFEHALEIANDTDFGLTGAVYTESQDKIDRAIREFHVGNLYINRKCTGAIVACASLRRIQYVGNGFEVRRPGLSLSVHPGETWGEDSLIMVWMAPRCTFVWLSRE